MHGLNLLKALNKVSYDVTCSCWHFTWVFGYYILVLFVMLQPKWQTCRVNEALIYRKTNQHARKCPGHIEACEQQSMTKWLCTLSCFCSLSVPFNSIWSRGWRYMLPLNWGVQMNGYSEWNTHSDRKFHHNINFVTHIRERQQTSQGFDPLHLSVTVMQFSTRNFHCVNSHKIIPDITGSVQKNLGMTVHVYTT